MKNSEIIDKVEQHLLKQGHPALSDQGMCNYLTSAGDMCAVGCLIPPELYNEDIEGDCFPAPDLLLAEIITEAGIPEEQWGLLNALQVVHDQYLKERRRGIAWGDYITTSMTQVRAEFPDV